MALDRDQKWLYLGFCRAMRHVMTEDDRKNFDKIFDAAKIRDLLESEEWELKQLFRKFDKEPNAR